MSNAHLNSKNYEEQIVRDPQICGGEPVFKGTRLTVQDILEELGSGMSSDDLLDNYPTLKPEHLQAALQYAAAVVGMDQSIHD